MIVLFYKKSQMIEVLFDLEILSNAIYRYVHLTGKWEAEVLDMHNSIHHNLWPFIFALSTVWQHPDRNARMPVW